MVVLDRPTSTTSAPIPVRPANPRRALRPKDFRPAEFGLLIVTVVAAISIVWIVFEQLTLLSGTFGFIVCCVVTFLCLYWTVNSLVYGRRVAADRFVSALVSIAALCMFIPLGLLIVYLVIKGWGLLSIHLFVSTQKGVPEVCTPGVPCPKPGILHAMVGTAEQIGLAAAMGIPLAILTAVYLSEVGGFGARAVRIVVTAMSGVPAIVAGLFVYTFWVITFKFSGFAGSLALALLLLPTVTRGTEEVLKIVPNDLREASRALAAPEWRTVWSVVLPTARSGLITAVLLGTAVALGETAPLLVTIAGNKILNANPFHGDQSALSLLAFTQVKSSQPLDIQLGYTAALVLFMGVFFLFVSGRFLGSDWLNRKIRNSMNRRRAQSSSDKNPNVR
ncbi:MAG: phosphate ABC transporter permease PstA [Acidimicrobiales bacterium]